MRLLQCGPDRNFEVIRALAQRNEKLPDPPIQPSDRLRGGFRFALLKHWKVKRPKIRERNAKFPFQIGSGGA